MTQERQTQPAQAAEESISVMLAMLSTRRPAGSSSERKFIRRFIAPLGTTADKRGNHFLRIGDAPIMWSCHTDSVHKHGGEQRLQRVGEFGIGLAKGEQSNCLGADDAAGVWLMCEMIRAKVPGLYVFHRDEESGCKGSRWLVKNNPQLVDGIKFAIALDRRDKTDIITFQSSERCCSDEFAASLALQLGMNFKACPNGSFTDTAQYTGLIGECTNLSVGYTGAHSNREELDGQFLITLRDKLIAIDVAALVSKRVAGTVEKKTYTYQNNSRGSGHDYYYDKYGYWGSDGKYHPYKTYGIYDADDYGGYYEDWGGVKSHHSNHGSTVQRSGHNIIPIGGVALTREEELKARKKWWQGIFDRPRKPVSTKAVAALEGPKTTSAAEDEDFVNGQVTSKVTDIVKLIRCNPAEVADFLEQYGVDVAELEQHILSTSGMIRYY